MAVAEIIISYEWIEVETDLSACHACGEIIYSKMKVLCITPTVNLKKNSSKMLDVKLCESCRDAIKSTE